MPITPRKWVEMPAELQSPHATDAQLLQRAVRDLADKTRFPVAFGGWHTEGTVQVSSIVGARTGNLKGLTIRPDRGLGGRAMTELRPRMTADYRTSRQITHDYDSHILGEGIASLLAVPVVIGGRTRAVLYGGAWASSSVGDVVAAAAFQVADALGTELRVRDEVARRLASAPPTEPVAIPAAQREELRESYAELRSIAAHVDDPVLRERLAQVERRLAAISVAGATSGAMDAAHADALDVRLSPRETDVLACVALGATNAEIASTLSLREGTVKAYLGSAMAKLDAATRHAAVTKARRAGLLP